MLIAIDHGNKQMKTIHKTFTSALKESDTRPPFGEDILEYQGKYYSLTGNRIPYLRDKTVDERFFLLTLFAIAFEIEEAGVYSADEIIDVQLAVGLPPAHFGAQADRFERYFLNRDVVSFTFRGKPYEVYINKVLCFPQAYAATIPIYDRIRKTTKAVVVDIGGFTADYLVFKNGEADLDACDSLENGVIILYNNIKSKLNGEMDMLLEESDIDAILQGDTSDFDNEVVQIVRQQAQGFVNARKHDSQDICFVQDGNYSGFIEQHTGKKYPEGNFIDTSGNILGRHRGIIHYTVGQRKGLGLAFAAPMYVCAVNAEDNTVTLGRNDELFSKKLIAKDINLISRASTYEPLRVKAKIRYRQAEQWATAVQLDGDTLSVEFDEPQRAITRGQAVVLYDGDTVVGGGTIQ